MHPDLERLIRLQSLDLELQQLHRTVETEADRRQAVEAELEQQRVALAAIRDRLAQNQQARRAIEKDLAQVQTRLSRYKDQLMAVKTNKEYHAMQTEIAAAEAEVRKFEDQVLESMVEGEELAAELRTAEQNVARATADARAAVERLEAETRGARERLVTAGHARAELATALPRATLAMFETIASRRGTAVVEARDGHCSVCHVRLRPQMFQEVRRNDAIHQCDSCQRILYYVPPVAQPASVPPA
jgi:predicted  nucleic acid-binding Zn-ribbon protein